MDYQEIWKMQQSREWKAAEELANASNSMSWNPKYFAMGVN